jgi:hypothetical protein
MSNILNSINKVRITHIYFQISEKFNNEIIQSQIAIYSDNVKKFFNSVQKKDTQKQTLFGREILKHFFFVLGIALSESDSLTKSEKTSFPSPDGQGIGSNMNIKRTNQKYEKV